MIHTGRRRLAVRGLMVVSVMALIGAVPVLGGAAQARTGASAVVTGGHRRAQPPSPVAAGAERAGPGVRPGITVDIGAPDAPVLPGRTYSWPYTVTNEGQAEVEKVTLSAPLPDHLEPVPGQDDCSWRQQVAVCPLGSMGNGETRSGVLTAKVADEACAGDDIAGTAAVTWGEALDTGRVRAAFPPVRVAEAADLSVTERAPAQVRPGSTAAYDVTVLNRGTVTAEHVVLRQTLRRVQETRITRGESETRTVRQEPETRTASAPPARVTGAGAACESGRREVVCDLGALEAGGTRKIRLNVLVNRNAGPCDITAPTRVTSSTHDVHRTDNVARPVITVVMPTPVRAALPARPPGAGRTGDHPGDHPRHHPGVGRPPAGPGGGGPDRRPEGLPLTGAPTRAVIGAALGLGGAGLALMYLGRRRRKSS
jgi:LPXTG-motif cell wall-anchored protein